VCRPVLIWYSMNDPATSDASVLEGRDGLRSGSDLVNRLLFNRGVITEEEVINFLQPDYDLHLHDSFLMADMEVAVARILKAISNKEKVLIYSDYDADGIPGAVVLHDFFKEVGFDNFVNYIPHRHDEGFGVNVEAVEKFASEGFDLLITIDCGVADTEAVSRAVELGLEVIVTDHHEPNGRSLPALATLDPKRPDCLYPNKDLCGAGVVFKLVQALIKAGEFDLAVGREKWYLDMVALATLSDMVSLQGENRVLAYFGLKVMARSRRPGLVGMFKQLRIDQRYVTEDDIGFMIAPRINAASRMGAPDEAFNFLAQSDPVEAVRAAKYLNQVNDERKGVVASIVKSVKKKMSKGVSLETLPVIVVGDPAWRPSLLGLVAGSLAEEFDRPIFLWGRDGQDVLKGSARSDGRVNLVELMSKASDVLDAHGGHSQAGGFAVSHEKVHLLSERLCEAFVELGHDKESPLDSGGSNYKVEADLKLDDVADSLCRQIERLAPFGIGNPKPVFRFREVTVGGIKAFGKQGDHLEIILTNSQGRSIKAISFFTKIDSFVKDLAVGSRVDLIANIERSFFAGREEVRLRIINIE